MTRVLIVNVNWLGDVLFSTPAIRAMRKKYPSSFIAVCVPSRVEAVIQNNPYLNEIITFPDKVPFLRLASYFPLVRKLKSRDFDTAVFFHRSKTKAFMTYAAGVPERIGFGGP